MSLAPEPDGSALFDFADQLLGDIEAGRELPLAHYLARFPGHEEHVAREYLLLTGKVGAEIEKVERAPLRHDRIGPYRLLEVLGRGGQGVVYRAVDTRLERAVALKVLSLPVASVSQGRRSRFRREAEILSRLDHPGVCTVLDADLDSETPYIAMRFVEGETLAAALTRAREARQQELNGPPTPATDASTSASRLLAPRRALELSETLAFFERAARALHAAHEAGVIHRDVKPGNIMVTKEGLPVILDFGLARGEHEESVVLTRVDEVFGTPAYLSPEQSRSGRDVDRRTDVYSLGVVLFECLTLERPGPADSTGSSTRARAPSAPLSLKRANPALPQDLAVVLEAAMERDVGRRYATALELAEELRRVREYEPIRARPAGVFLRTKRWAQRNPVVATAVIGSIAALSSALAITLVLLRRVNEEKAQKESALHLYEGGWYRDEATSSIASSPPRALRFAIVAAEQDPGLASNRTLLAALEAMHLRQVLVGHTEPICHIDIDPASHLLASCAPDGVARIWNLHTGLEVSMLAPDRGPLYAVCFSPQGDRVALGGHAGFSRIVPLAPSGATPVDLAVHTGDVHWIEFSSDGERVLTASRDHIARVCDARTGREIVRLESHTGNLSEARWFAEDRLIVTRSGEPIGGGSVSESDATARVFDGRTGAELSLLGGHTASIVAVAISPDSRRLVTVSEDRTARQWLLDTRVHDPTPERVFEAPGKFHDAMFSPDGRRLALCWDAGAKVVDVETGTTLFELPDHDHRAIVRIAFSPDGDHLATIAYDDAVRVFRAGDGSLVYKARGDSRQMSGLRWSPDGDSIVTWNRLKTVEIWYGRERPFLQVLRGHEGPVRTACFDARGSRVLTSSADGTARTWDASTGRPLVVFDPLAVGRSRAPLIGATFDEAGERVLTTEATGHLAVWRARDGVPLAAFEGVAETEIPAAFSRDGERLAATERPGCVVIVEPATGRVRRLVAHDGVVTSLRFSPDEKRLVTGGDDRRVCLWDATIPSDAPRESETREPVWRSEPFDARMFRLRRVFDARMSPDGRWVVACCENGHLQLHDAATGRLCDSYLGATPGRVAFDFESRLVMAASKYGGSAAWARIEAGADGPRLLKLPQQPGAGLYHQNGLTSITAARNAHIALTTSLDRTARLWDLAGKDCLASCTGHADAVLDGDIAPDGRTIVTASADGTARLWPCDLLATARKFEPESSRRALGPLPVPKERTAR